MPCATRRRPSPRQGSSGGSSDRRAKNLRDLVRNLKAADGLRDDLSIGEAADTIWATSSSELYVMLTVERGWSADRYERWLADTWRRLLLRNT